MDDIIRIGLDFGTHQTKICIQRTPDEGHGEPMYEFFKFTDDNGVEQYVLPSVVQINADNTLSYGYIDTGRRDILRNQDNDAFDLKFNDDISIDELALKLYDKYSTTDNPIEDVEVLSEMLTKRKKQLSREYDKKYLYRYFKQATFAERPWIKDIEPIYLSIWYLAYIIFLLEERFGTDFSLNMGIPAGEKEYEQKKRLAVRVLLTAYNLVEGVYQFNVDDFLSATIDELKANTQILDYSEDEKLIYGINIFPEAYASLISLTSRGKITPGMSLMADVGGGTTDISFFTLGDGKPRIYRYWSIPRGLNYIAENSGFDYADSDFAGKVNKDIVKKYNTKKLEMISILIKDLVRCVGETCVPVSSLYYALKNRVLVYTGGGSIYPFVTESILDFTDVKFVDDSMWKEEHVVDKPNVSKLCKILATAYGLSLDEDDAEVKLEKFSTLFDTLPKQEDKGYGKEYVGKEQC